MQIKEDFKAYTDEFGLVQPKGETTGNGLLYTAEYILALVRWNCLEDKERKRLIEVYKSCEIEPGFLMRAPNKVDDQEGPDDYIGAGVASYYLDDGALAKRILEYGKNKPATKLDLTETDPDQIKHNELFWSLFKRFGPVSNVWNNRNPETFDTNAWLGRQPQLICHLKFCAGEDPTLLEKLWWAGSLLFLAFAKKEEHDKYILSYLKVDVARGKSSICDWVISIWEDLWHRHWNSLGELLDAYFADGDEEHPLVKYLK